MTTMQQTESSLSAAEEVEPQFLKHADDATRLLNKRRQLFDIKERFASEKEKYDEKIKDIEQREADLCKRDLDFQAKIVRFKIFITENESKQQKLARRLAEEIKLSENLDRNGADMEKSLAKKKQQLKELEETAKQGQKYREVLGNEDITDVLERYESAKKIRERLEAKLESLRKQNADVAEVVQATSDEPSDETSAPEQGHGSDDSHTVSDKAADEVVANKEE